MSASTWSAVNADIRDIDEALIAAAARFAYEVNSKAVPDMATVFYGDSRRLDFDNWRQVIGLIWAVTAMARDSQRGTVVKQLPQDAEPLYVMRRDGYEFCVAVRYRDNGDTETGLGYWIGVQSLGEQT